MEKMKNLPVIDSLGQVSMLFSASNQGFNVISTKFSYNILVTKSLSLQFSYKVEVNAVEQFFCLSDSLEAGIGMKSDFLRNRQILLNSLIIVTPM